MPGAWDHSWMPRIKRRWTITLDPAVAEALGGDEEALSEAVEGLLRDEVERRQRSQALARTLRVMTADRGPVGEGEVEDFRRLAGVGAVVLDAGSVSTLARGGDQERTVRAALTAFVDTAEVVVPATALVELYGGPQALVVDDLLGSEGGISVVPTDRPLARRMARILVDAGRGADDHMCASLVAVCAAAGGGLILTREPRKVTELCGAATTIAVRSIGAKWRPALFGSTSTS